MPNILIEQIIGKLVSTTYNNRLINNVARGPFVECMVALALGEPWRPSSEIRDWAPWDIESGNGARIEVKQSAFLQTWSLSEDSPPRRTNSFDIAARTEAWTKGGGFPNYLPGRPADIYVFAWHPVSDPEVADHRCPQQWEFFVVPERHLPDQKSISITRVQKLYTEILLR